MSFFKKLFGNRNDDNNANDYEQSVPVAPTTFEDIIEMDIDSLPDSSFTMQRDINIEGNIIVIFSKKLPYWQAGLFDSILLRIFNTGEINVSLNGSRYTAKQFDLIESFLSKVYKVAGKDSTGSYVLAADDRRYLQLPGNLGTIPIWINWNATKHCTFSGELNNEISFTFSRPSSQKILEQFYLPNAGLTDKGLLHERQMIFDQTFASTEYDEFEKKRTYKLTTVAGSTNSYLFMYSFEGSIADELIERTKLAMTFTFSNGYFFLHLISYDKNFQLDKGDPIIFLFKDESTIELTPLIPKIKQADDSFRTAIGVTADQIRDFAMKPLQKWKITSLKHGVYQVGGFAQNIYIDQYKTETEGAYLLNTMIRALIKCILEHENQAIAFTLEE